MKKFLAVLMVLVLSASLLAGAMAGEKVVKNNDLGTYASALGSSFKQYETWHYGEVKLKLNLKKESLGDDTVEYQAEPVWNILISEDALVWDVTQTDRTDAVVGQRLTWDPETRTYTKNTEVGSTTATITPSTSFKMDTTPKTLTLTNRSNFDVDYVVGISKNFTVDKAEGRFSFENNTADISITPVESLILDSLQSNGTTFATFYWPASADSNIALEEDKPAAVGAAFLFFNRVGNELYTYEGQTITEIASSSGN